MSFDQDPNGFLIDKHFERGRHKIKKQKGNRKMKKIFAILLCFCMIFTVVSCGNKEAEYKLGMGVVVSMDSSSTGNAQVDATVATVVTDADGKIVACRIDVAQNKMAVANGAVNTAATFKTKMEKGTEYGMAGKVDNDGNGVMLEWDAQTKAFETYVVGKTVADVKAIQTKEANGHQIAVDQALLDAGCSMQITDFIAAVVKACEDTQGMTFKTAETFTLGVAAKTTVDSATVAATAEANGTVAMYTDFAASVVADGKILASLNDAIQPKITITAAGEIAGKSFKATKRELKEEYGMAGKVDNNGDGVKLEWYVQSEAFSKFVVGKTATEVAGLETQLVNNHQISTNADLLAAGCTIQITGIKAVVAASATNAR
jgi:hypothetical protein